VLVGGQAFAVELAGDEVTVDGALLDLAMEYTPASLVEAEVDGDVLGVKVKPTRGGFQLTTRGAIHRCRCCPPASPPIART
jgi:propionyl-CoA carboxylase alpha chain